MTPVFYICNEIITKTLKIMLLDILKIIFGDGNSSNPSKTGLDRIRELGGTVFDESIPADAARKHRDKNSGWI